jgi:hypothetical protein
MAKGHCLGPLVLAVETHENRLEAHRYLNMNDLKEHKRPTSAKPHNPANP